MFFGGDPFDHFSHMHGGGGGGGRPGRGGGGGGKPDDTLYKALGVERSADEAEIKRAYKKLALKVLKKSCINYNKCLIQSSVILITLCTCV